jgi:hypothetical protein
MSVIKPSLLAYLRANMDNMQVSNRTEIETDQGKIVQYEIWFMEASHILRGIIEVVEDDNTPYQIATKSLPMEDLISFLNDQ